VGWLTAFPQTTIAVFKGPTSKRRNWKGEREERKEKGKGKKRGRDLLDQCQTASYAPELVYKI